MHMSPLNPSHNICHGSSVGARDADNRKYIITIHEAHEYSAHYRVGRASTDLPRCHDRGHFEILRDFPDNLVGFCFRDVSELFLCRTVCHTGLSG